MEENVKSNDHILSDIWFAIKRHIILILVIIILSTIGGYVYSLLKTPLYTTSQQVVCTAIDEGGKKDDSGNKGDIIANFNAMNAYIGTIVDFSDEGVVIDRANFYYVLYAKELSKDSTLTVDDFIKDMISVPINQDPYSTQDSNQAQVQNQYIIAKNIGIVSNVDDANNEFSFFVKYTDGDARESQDKARILVLALRRELETEKGTVDSKYFSGIAIAISDLGSNGTTSNISKGKSTAVGATFGIIISMIVCIISVCDKSLKTKEDLEEISEAPVFACIEYDGGKK